MINRIIRFSVDQAYTIIFLTALLVIGGLFAFQHLPIDAVPDISNNQVQVNSTVEGLSPEEIERQITYPVESSMRGLPGVEQVRSITRFGLSQVTVVFKDSVDIYRARQFVSERLSGVLPELPRGTESKLGPVSSGLGEIFMYALDYEKPADDPLERLKQLTELRAVQDWIVKPRLLSVEGVAEINTSGGLEKQFHVQPDPKKMASYGVHFGEIQEAIEKINRNVGGGYVEQTAEQFLVQGIGQLGSVEDIENVQVRKLENFRTIRVRDVAKVTLGKELRTGAATYNGREALLGTVMMLLGENSRTVSIRVAERVKEVLPFLPPGIKLDTVYNRSVLVNATLGTVEHNLIMGASLVIAVLLLLVGNIRAALVTALTIPFSLLGTFLIMKPFGISGNLMSLGALDFGIIVDGTVIVIDHCVGYIQKQRSTLGRALTRGEVKEAVYNASVEIRQAAGFGQLIIVIVFLPIFALGGIEGKMFIPMASTFAIAVFCALLLSFTTTPALASILLSGATEDKEPKLMRLLRDGHATAFNWAFGKRKSIIAISATAVIAGLVLLAARGSEFLPQLGEGSFAFNVIRPVQIGLDQSIEFQKKAEEIIKEFPEVDHVFARIGTSEVATDPMGVNIADCYIMLKPREAWPKGEHSKHTYESLAQEMIDRLNRKLPGQTYLASQPIQMRFNELLEGTRADVTVKVFGPDVDKIVEISDQIKDIVSTVKGAGDVEIDISGKMPILQVKGKDEAIANAGGSLNDILETIGVAIGGQEAGKVYENDRRYPIIIRLNDSLRSNLTALKALPVGLGANSTTPLENLATLSFAEKFASIPRENGQRRAAVMINLRGRDTASFVEEAQKLVSAKVKIPTGYYAEWGGNFKNLQSAKERLSILVPLALLLVLVMIYAAFRSVGETLLIFSCVPLSWFGGVVSLYANGLPFSISAAVGFIALSGIAVLNGVVLVNFFNQLKAEGKTGFDLVSVGTLMRLRPVVMTALVAVFGFIPMMISQGVGAEVQKPLASVVIGGVISSTVLTLFVLPILFSVFEKKLHGRAGVGH
ncbi:MAG: efflux RND transporter permease subunit [Bdellovibrionales bacterium]|nr:efflux RND transporter permease subunit [Bdellovibrionales bacterium]